MFHGSFRKKEGIVQQLFTFLLLLCGFVRDVEADQKVRCLETDEIPDYLQDSTKHKAAGSYKCKLYPSEYAASPHYRHNGSQPGFKHLFFKQVAFKLFKYFKFLIMLLSNYFSSSNRSKDPCGGYFRLKVVVLILFLNGSYVDAGSCPAGVTTSSGTTSCSNGEYLCGYSGKGCAVSFCFLCISSFVFKIINYFI